MFRRIANRAVAWGGFRWHLILTASCVAIAAYAAMLITASYLNRPRDIGLEQAGCAYLKDVGAAHAMPVSSCRIVSHELVGPYATATFRIEQVGTKYTLTVRFVRSPWQVTAASQ